MDLSTLTPSAATNQELIEALREVSKNQPAASLLLAEAAKRLEEFQTAVNLPDPKTAIKTSAVREKRKSRADRYSDAQGNVSQAKSDAEDLRDELQNWRDGLPENLSNGSKAEQLDEAISNLDTFIQSAEEAEGTASRPKRPRAPTSSSPECLAEFYLHLVGGALKGVRRP
jgi:DNA repair exonuclease SbcCD ATPase subunit